MSNRVLHIAAYDVSNSVRLREALPILKGYASGRQKLWMAVETRG